MGQYSIPDKGTLRVATINDLIPGALLCVANSCDPKVGNAFYLRRYVVRIEEDIRDVNLSGPASIVLDEDGNTVHHFNWGRDILKERVSKGQILLFEQDDIYNHDL